MDLKETYNQIAADWCADHKQDDWWFKGTDKFISFLKPGDLLLDVGCAGGLKSQYFIEHGLRVVGIDLSEKMIDIAKREVPAADFFALDLDEVGKLDYSFDAIFMQAVLLHIPREEAAAKLEKIEKKLKPGGYLYIAVKEKRANGKDEEVLEENDYGYKYERFFSYFTKEEIEKYLLDLGLEIIFSDITASGKTNWIQVIARK